MTEDTKTPKDVAPIQTCCKTIPGIILQQQSVHRYLASAFCDDLKVIHSFLLKEASTSFGCDYDGSGNSALGALYGEVAYGILPELVSHVLKMDPHTDGDFAKMYKMVIDIFCNLTAVCPVELMAFLFSTFASLLLYFNEKKPSSSTSSLQAIVVYKLCYYMFPLCLVHPRSEVSCHSMVPAVISSVLDISCTGEDMQWCTQIIDILMSLKKDVCLDIVTLISSGTKRVRKQAEKILMRYWLRAQEKQNGEEILKVWQLEKCCLCRRTADLVCINPTCDGCAAYVHEKIEKTEDKYFHFCFSHARQSCENVFQIAKPIGIEDSLSGSCQLGNCHGTAVLACFHPDCISLGKTNQSFVRLCSECAASCHDNEDCDHIFQDGLQCPWDCHNRITSIAFLGALSRLLEDILITYQCNPKEAQSVDHDNAAAIIMLDQYCQCPARELDDDMHNWMVHLVSLVLNWLYEIIDRQESTVVGKRIIPWLVRTLNQEVAYIAEPVLPNLPTYAQVGKLWNSVHSMVERRKHTLEIIEMLQNKILINGKADKFYQVFDNIMPFWLKELSGSPDQLEALKDYFKKLFEASDDRERNFRFIKIAIVNDKDSQETKEALCWLQALTRMNIKIPFLREIIQQAVHKPTLSKISSFDIKASSKHIPAAPYGSRRSSWSDSEYSDTSIVSGLVTRSSVEYTGEILDVDSTLTRYILMLDIWLSQIKLVEDFSILQFPDIQGVVLNMLKDSHNWGSYHNHSCPSEICLLCYAIVLWFNLANLIFDKYTPSVPMQCAGDEEAQGQPQAAHRPSRASYIVKFFTLRKIPAAQDQYLQEGRTSVASTGSINEQTNQPTSPVREKPLPFHRERKIARMDTHTNYTFVSESLQENPNKHKKKAENTGKIYKIFQECLKLWRPIFIPEATYQIILFITTLFRSSKSLNEEPSYSTYSTDVEKLITNLWNSLVCEYTYLAKAAVFLLFECLERLATPTDVHEDLQQMKFRSMVDSKFEQDSYTKRFEVVEKAFLIVQFTEDVKKLSLQTLLSLSLVFCHLVGSLQDSSSHVATRAQYCLRSLKKSANVTIQDAMTSAFNMYPNHRSLILTTISLLNSNLPQMPTTPIKFFVGLDPYSKLVKACHLDVVRKRKKKGLEEKLSVASHSIQFMNEYLNSNQSNAAILQQMLALLMQVLGHPEFNANLLEEVVIEIAPPSSAGGQEKEKVPLTGQTVIMDFFQLVVCQHFVPPPVKLRESHFFETYLRNIYQVLDVNTTFGNALEVLSFNLRLLIFSACSNFDDYQSLSERAKETDTSLALLDSSLCLAWLRVFFVICYKYVDRILQSEEKEKLQDYVSACVMITLKTLQRTTHYCIPSPTSSTQDQGIFSAASRNMSITSFESGTSSTTMGNNRQVDDMKCPLCNATIGNTHGEEIVTQCIVTLSTALHHMPVLTLRHLIDTINALARVALPDPFSWDNTNKMKDQDQSPNSASNVSKQYLKCLLTQHGDRKLFLYLFKYCNRKELMEAIFISLPPPTVEQDNSANLDEGEENNKKADKPILDQISPVQYFLEDLPEEPNILRRPNVIVNLSNYLHLIKDVNGRKILFVLVPQFEFFFEKVKHLPKTTEVDTYNAILKIMVLVTNILSEHPPKLLLVQQFASYHCPILLMGFKYTSVPLHGLVKFCSSWYNMLKSHTLGFTSLENIINALSNEMLQVLKLKLPNMPVNFITLLKFFILCFHGNIGYIDDIFNDANTIFCCDLHETEFFNHVAATLPQIILLECLGFLCSRVNSAQVCVHDFKLHVSKLLVTNLCSTTPSKSIISRLQQIDATLKASLSEDRTVQSVLKTSAGFLVALGWMMVGAMKLTAMRQIFYKQLSEVAHEWDTDIYRFLYQIWNQQPLDCVNALVNSTLNLIVKNCNTPGLDKDIDIIKNLFMFLEIWTVYLEVVLPKEEDNTIVVIEVWRNVIQCIYKIPMLIDTTISILCHLNKAVLHIKRANLFLTPKITPFWRETQKLGKPAQYCTELWKEVGDNEATETSLAASGRETITEHSQKQTGSCCSRQRGLDPWYNCVLQRLTNMDGDYRTDIMG